VVVGGDSESFLGTILWANSETPRPGTIIEEDDSPWHTFRHRGALQFAIADEPGRFIKTVILEAAPDLFLFVAGGEAIPERLALLKTLHQFDSEHHQHTTPIIAVGPDPARIVDAFAGESALQSHLAAVLPTARHEAILAAMASALPNETRLEFARVSGEKAVQREIATSLTRSATAVCAAIGAQPIPLADLPILTAIQVLMISGIIHVAGREWSFRMVRDFLAALGINVGAALLLREGTRAASKLLPGFGNAISGAVAGAGTLALGRAATAYFIEGHNLDETRQRFLREKTK
jgi:uncharacterized protein (DUF697 family)